jgi:ATP-dependent helicase/nuclease subunit A
MTGPVVPFPDAAARRLAVTAFDRNLVVVAGAGTGKTSLLVERTLNAIGTGVLTIDRLAAITFTEKAAGELRTRLAVGLERLRALAMGAEAGSASEASRSYGYLIGEAGIAAELLGERALAALLGLERARVTTIHGLCAEILREHPVEADLPPDFEIDAGGRADALVAREREEFLTEELGERAARSELWEQVLGEFAVGDVTGLTAEIGGFEVAPEALTATAPDARAWFGAEAAELRTELANLLTGAPAWKGVGRETAEALVLALGAFLDRGIEALAAACASDPRLARAGPGGSNKSTPGGYETLSREAWPLCMQLASVGSPSLRPFREAVAPFARRAREVCVRDGVLSFQGLLILTRDLLRDVPAVREALKRRFRMLLVDEFQDTDPMQYEIVFFLAEAEGGQAADPFLANLAPGRLLVVGDPKQSIYRFRGADYTAFVRALSRIAPQPEQRVSLVTSFRSDPRLLDAVNALFAPGGAWEPSPYQPAYEAIAAGRPPSGPGGPRVELWSIDAGAGANAAGRRDAEGQAIAAEVEALIERGEARPRDIFLLLRAVTNLPLYLRPLRERGIPFVVDGGKEFAQRSEVVQMIAALRALARPGDPVALLAFLRSPAAGVPDSELLAWAESGARWSWRDACDPGRFPVAARGLSLLRALAEEAKEHPVDLLVRRVVSRCHLLTLGAFGYEGAQRVANLGKLQARLVSLCRDGGLTLNEALDEVEQERPHDLEGESPLADEGTDALHVLTIHRAKGLERPIVIIPDLARRPAGSRNPPRVRVGRGPGGEPVLGLRVEDHRDLERVYLDREQERHEEAEGIRTLYVAATRARERLILAGARSQTIVPWLDALSAWGFDARVGAADGALLAGGSVVHRALLPSPRRTRPPRIVARDEAEAVTTHARAVAALRGAARPPLAAPSGIHEEDEARRESSDAGTAPRGRDLARAAGSVVHRLLERWDLAAGESLLAPLAGEVERIGFGGADPTAVEREARAILEAFLAGDLPGRLRGVEILGREVPLLLRRDDGAAWQGSLDLLFREANGEVVIADYKTDLVEAGAAERYAGQLGVYSEAVRRALSLDAPPRAELWFLRSGRVVPL